MVLVDVYGDTRATCTQRVLILLEELDLKYNVIKVDLLKNEHKTKDFLKLQPFGKIPVIKYDDRVVFESRSILKYIAKNNIDIKDLFGGTDVDIWLEVESQNYNPPASKIINEKLFKKWKGEKADEDVVKKSLEELEKVLDVYEGRLSEYPYIGGDFFSIADISHIPYTNYLLKCGYKDLYKKRPNVYKWLKRIIKRDSVQYVTHKLEQPKESKIIEKDEKESKTIEKDENESKTIHKKSKDIENIKSDKLDDDDDKLFDDVDIKKLLLDDENIDKERKYKKMVKRMMRGERNKLKNDIE